MEVEYLVNGVYVQEDEYFPMEVENLVKEEYLNDHKMECHRRQRYLRLNDLLLVLHQD
jgi:hypothetical protein